MRKPHWDDGALERACRRIIDGVPLGLVAGSLGMSPATLARRVRALKGGAWWAEHVARRPEVKR